MTPATADIFVSYKAEDRSRVAPIVAALQAEGFDVWWDAHIGGGSNWREDIETHLESARCVIVFWSLRSVGPEGDFVRDEAGRARRLGTYLPVRIDAVDPPLGFGEIQALSLAGWTGNSSDPRFRALADAVRSRVDGGPLPRPSAAIVQPRVSRRGMIAGGAAVAAVAGAGAAGWWWFGANDGVASRRIAVLPFANLSGDPSQAYFSDGVAEELRSALTRIGLEVIGRISSDTVRDMDAGAAAARLGVASILTGSVRRSAELIRVNAQLVNGADGVERWTESYDRAPGDAIAIQTDIAENVARALSVTLGQAARTALTLGGTRDSIAQELLLKAYALRGSAGIPDRLLKAAELAGRAIARDPNYADAYIYKAEALSGYAVEFGEDETEVARLYLDAEAAIRQALAIAPQSGAAYNARAALHLYRTDFSGALRDGRRAMELAPNDLSSLRTVAYLAWLGDDVFANRALAVVDRFKTLDPYNPRVAKAKLEILFLLRRYSETIEAARAILKSEPSGSVRFVLASSLLMLGHHDKARSEVAALEADDVYRPEGLALVAARSGEAAEAVRLVGEVKKRFGRLQSYFYAQVHAQLGDKERAFAALSDAADVNDASLTYLKRDAFLDPLRSDPRFQALLRRLAFP